MATERTDEQVMAGRLRQGLDALVRTEGSMSNADVLAGCTEFWVQVFVDAFLAEADAYPGRSWTEVMGELEGVLAAMQTQARRRLLRSWQRNLHAWQQP